MKLKIIYEDEYLLVIDKPAGITVFSENKDEKTLINSIIEEYPELKKAGQPPRYGMVHRLDKETSGILLIAKDNKTLDFLQKQFKEKRVIKKYLALVVGNLKEDIGTIETLIGRAPGNRKRQKIYLPYEPGARGKREATTEYKVLERFREYTLVEVIPKTGRKHQIRAHFAYLHHPIAGDKLYGFKNQLCPKDLKRQFLHANYLKIKLPDGKIREFKSDLPEDLKNIIKKL